ncbi:hypothetical protein B7494_g7484 [Chlorociboria aeruginascens]|nr:hypothetical protein B7494_g7484 [Chlorociboria aeruginascens]
MTKIPATIGENYVLPIALPPTPAYPQPATHHIYLRPHNPKIPTEDDSRSLFLMNVPVDSTPSHFRAIFTTLIGAGRFESIIFEEERRKASSVILSKDTRGGTPGKKRKRGAEEDEKDTSLPQVWDRELRRSGSTAVVVLVDKKAVESTLKAIRKLHKSSISDNYPIWGSGTEGKTPTLGASRYLTHQKLRYPDTRTLQESVDAYMTEFNRKEEERAREAKRMRNVPDEDGFVTVVRGGRTGPARREEAEEKRKEMLEKEERRKKEMNDFYRFQMREKRKEEQGELVRRFEEDRRRVDSMREKRGKFRPEK